MNRRACLRLLAAAPLAVMTPWRPPLASYHVTFRDSCSVWMMRWRADRVVGLLAQTNEILLGMEWRESGEARG